MVNEAYCTKGEYKTSIELIECCQAAQCGSLRITALLPRWHLARNVMGASFGARFSTKGRDRRLWFFAQVDRTNLSHIYGHLPSVCDCHWSTELISSSVGFHAIIFRTCLQILRLPFSTQK